MYAVTKIYRGKIWQVIENTYRRVSIPYISGIAILRIEIHHG